jgi:acetyl-CoA acetyltransferase
MSLRGKAAIVGVAQAGMGEAPGRTSLELLAEASVGAVREAGLTLNDVDGLFVSAGDRLMPTLSAAEYLGLRPRFSDSNMIGGASFVAHLLTAAMALSEGLCDVALVAYGSNQRTAAGRMVGEPLVHEMPYRARSPLTAYALAASRHMHEFGTTRRDLAAVAVAARDWARLNPEALMRGPLTVEDVLASRMVSDPLSKLDCCLVTDGAAAAVLVRADRAGNSPKQPVFVLGVGSAHWHREIAAMPDLTRTAASESGPRAFEMARLAVSDVDVVQLYDAFTINTILFLEDLGFCPKGEGGRFVADGAIAPGGLLPVNTNGGGLSCVHPGMYGLFMIVEAVRQLRGDCGSRQITGAEVALVHGNGGSLSSQVTALLGTEATI